MIDITWEDVKAARKAYSGAEWAAYQTQEAQEERDAIHTALIKETRPSFNYTTTN